MLALAGWAWESTDRARAEDFLRRAAQAAAEHPADDHSELLLLLNWLQARAMLSDQGGQAIEYARRIVWQSNKDALVDAVADVFAAYAQYGAGTGFQHDLEIFSPYMVEPEVLYAVGRVYARSDQPLIAEAYYSAAAAAGLGDAESHLNVGKFLLDHRWIGLARREFNSLLNTPGEIGQLSRFDGRVRLAECADAVGEDLQAAAERADALKAVENLPPNLHAQWESLPAIILSRQLRAAMHDNNKAQITERVTQLLNMQINDPAAAIDINIDIVQGLRKLGRNNEAEHFFQTIYAQPKATLDSKPHSPTDLNNLAWLCARCGEHKSEAYQWASEAIKLIPLTDDQYAADLDTAAEAAAAVGKWDEAVQHETNALRLLPDDWFMQTQLARFKAELKKQANPREE
jgi:tetratricopeptide (TPR) repeat protein